MRLFQRGVFLLTALGAGVAQAFSIADPWFGQPRWWLQLLSLALLAGLMVIPGSAAADWTSRDRLWNGSRLNGHKPAWRQGLWLGWLFALGWLVGVFWWLFISMHTYGGLNAAIAVTAVLALAGLLALYYGVACALFMALRPTDRRSGGLTAALLFAALWTLAELARGSWFTGFPWGAGGYAHVDGPLSFLARYAGVYGIGFVAAAIAMFLVVLPRFHWTRWPVYAGLLVVLAVGGAGWVAKECAGNEGGFLCTTQMTQSRMPPMDVALLQGNIPQDEKFVMGTGVVDSLQWYGERLRDAEASLVVGPETAIPVLPRQLPNG